ncbi:MAG: hypothetical protein WKF70_03410, partial [Chitinophagaceae bacterium]
VRETLKEQIVELEELSVNGVLCAAQPVVVSNRRGTISDAYYLCDLQPTQSGKFEIKALLKHRYSGSTRTIVTTISSQ